LAPLKKEPPQGALFREKIPPKALLNSKNLFKNPKFEKKKGNPQRSSNNLQWGKTSSLKMLVIPLYYPLI